MVAGICPCFLQVVSSPYETVNTTGETVHGTACGFCNYTDCIVCVSGEVWLLNMGLGPFRGILGTLNGTYGIYSGYIRVPGLGAHTFFQPLTSLGCRV